MSPTLLAWLAILVFCILKGIGRPAWMLCGYLQTVFVAPSFWWWGKSVPSLAMVSWSFYLGILVIVSLLLNPDARNNRSTASEKICFFCLLMGSLNVAIVHFLLANDPDASYRNADIFWKTSLILFLFYRCIRNFDDLILVLGTIFSGCAFIGYQVVFANQGYTFKGRLEGIAIPGASDSNLISGILLIGLLIGGYFTISEGQLWKKIYFVFGSVLILETLLRNNSRGAYLSMGIAGVVFLIFSSGKARSIALKGSVLGGIAILLMAKNQAIWDRFFSTFAEAEGRDESAQSRLDYWRAAMDMISSFPLGSGGEAAFMSPRGMSFISHLTDQPRAVHNGFLDLAAGWGVQGFLLLAIPVCACFGTVAYTSRLSKQNQDVQVNLLCALLISIGVSQLSIAMFLSSLDCEIPLMTFVLCLSAWRVYYVVLSDQPHLDLDSEMQISEDTEEFDRFNELDVETVRS
jgi:O-antigen ligase